MKKQNFDSVWKEIDKHLGEGSGTLLKQTDKGDVRRFVGKIMLMEIESTSAESEFQTIKDGLIRVLAGLDQKNRPMEDKRVELDEIMKIEGLLDDLTIEHNKRVKALWWLTAEKAVDLIEGEWAKIDEYIGGLKIILDLSGDGEKVKQEFDKWKLERKRTAKVQSDKISWIKEMAPDIEWEKELDVEESDGCICFYKKGDKYRFIPVVAFFPGLTEEEIVRVNDLMDGNLPNDYKEFLKRANGVMMAGIYQWWGVRKFYNESKHLIQNFSLINGRIDEQMMSYLSNTEVVIGSDRYRNLYLMDLVTREVKGLIRKNGDEMAMPEIISFKNLGDLLTHQTREAMMVKDF